MNYKQSQTSNGTVKNSNYMMQLLRGIQTLIFFATHGDGRLKKLIKVNLIKIFFRNALDY
jgi:hypothetical protein